MVLPQQEQCDDHCHTGWAGLDCCHTTSLSLTYMSHRVHSVQFKTGAALFCIFTFTDVRTINKTVTAIRQHNGRNAVQDGGDWVKAKNFIVSMQWQHGLVCVNRQFTPNLKIDIFLRPVALFIRLDHFGVPDLPNPGHYGWRYNGMRCQTTSLSFSRNEDLVAQDSSRTFSEQFHVGTIYLDQYDST